MKKKNNITLRKNHYIIMVFIFLTICFLGVGYAQITGIGLNITGNIVALHQEGLFISNINYNSSTSFGNEANSTMQAIYGTLSQGNITLGNNVNSNVTFTVDLINSDSVDDYIFISADKANSFYNNNDIKYDCSIVPNTVISHNSSSSFNITFSYDGILPNNHDLSGYINFRFRKAYHITYGSGIVTAGYNHPVAAPIWEQNDTDSKTIAIDFGTDAPSSVQITGTNASYTLNTDYTYSNGILTFPNGLKSDITITGVTSTHAGTLSDPYVNSSSTYDPTNLDDGYTIFEEAAGVPLVNVVDGKVTSFEFTEPGNGVLISNGNTLDTGVIAFDGEPFTIYLRFTGHINGNLYNHFLAALHKDTNTTYSGFILDVYKSSTIRAYSFKNQTIGTGGGSNTQLASFSIKKSTADSQTQEYVVKVIYNGTNSSNNFSFYMKPGASNGNASTQNATFTNFNVNDATIKVGGNGVNSSYDFSSMTVKEFWVKKEIVN